MNNNYTEEDYSCFVLTLKTINFFCATIGAFGYWQNLYTSFTIPTILYGPLKVNVTTYVNLFMYDFFWSWGLKDTHIAVGTAITLVRVFVLITFGTTFITMFSVCIAPIPNRAWKSYYIFFICIDLLVVISSCIAWSVFLTVFPPQKLPDLKTDYGWAWSFTIAVFVIGIIVVIYELAIVNMYSTLEKRERAEANALPSTIGKRPLSPRDDTYYDEFGHPVVANTQAQAPPFGVTIN